MSRARFAFAAHPDAIADLRELPDEVRDLALLEPQNLVHGSDDCLPLKGRLAGFHKVYVDPSVSCRMVIQFRSAPPTSNHKREICLVAAGSRKDYAVYRSAHLRTGPHQDTESASATEGVCRPLDPALPVRATSRPLSWQLLQQQPNPLPPPPERLPSDDRQPRPSGSYRTRRPSSPMPRRASQGSSPPSTRRPPAAPDFTPYWVRCPPGPEWSAS